MRRPRALRARDAVSTGAPWRKASGWAAAFWIKPFVVVPAAVCWWLSRGRGRIAGSAAATRGLEWRGLLADIVVVGVPGVVWLAISGAFPYFWVVFTEWNPEYGGRGAYQIHIRYELWRQWYQSTLPWGLVSLPAIPVAGWVLWRHRSRALSSAGPEPPVSSVLLAGFYLGWVLQAAYLQARPHAYALSSAVLIAVPLIAAVVRPPRSWVIGRQLVAAGFAVVAALVHPLSDTDRVGLWSRAAAFERDPGLRNHLSLHGERSPRPDWAALDHVARFLRAHAVRDGDVVCFNDSTHPLYLELGIAPPVRYMQFNLVRDVFRDQRETVRRELASAGARFVVSDLVAIDIPPNASVALLADPWVNLYPWNQPIVFRAGRYLVHEVRAPVADFWLTF